MSSRQSKSVSKSKNKLRDQVSFYLNGQLTHVTGDDAFMMLAEWLRKRAHLTGTKIVCAEGDCGACTVLRAFEPTDSKKKPTFVSMNSCIATVAQMDGSHLVTVEGLAYEGELAPAQTAMRECHGSQCGYCTPGFVMALSGALEIKESIDRKTAANYFTGNLCRCTGYSPILDAAEMAKPSPKHNLSNRYLTSNSINDLRQLTKTGFDLIDSTGRQLFAPTTLKEACQFISRHKSARLMAATTDLGVQTNKGKPLPRELLSLQNVTELYEIDATKSVLTLGARVNLARLRRATVKHLPEFASFLDIFASPQIKNVATLVGNLANASPIGDTLPFLLASEAQIHTARFANGKLVKRKIPATEFFLGYKKLALKADELIWRVEVPINIRTKNIRLFKASQRKDLDISAVSAALSLNFKKSGQITDAAVALGGIAATPVRVAKVESYLLGKLLTPDVASEATALLNAEINPIGDVRGTNTYRRVLINQIFGDYLNNCIQSREVV